jgi:hypothetical protein
MLARTVNSFSKSYFNRMKKTMPICGVLLKYKYESFSFNILEIARQGRANTSRIKKKTI